MIAVLACRYRAADSISFQQPRSLSSVGTSHQFLAPTSGTCTLLASEVGTEPERLRGLLYLLARSDFQEPAKAVVTIGVGLIVLDERENALRLAHRKNVAPHGRFAIGVLTGSASELTCLALPKGKAFDNWTFKYSTRELTKREANARWAFSPSQSAVPAAPRLPVAPRLVFTRRRCWYHSANHDRPR
jgi:hypothetical protein